MRTETLGQRIVRQREGATALMTRLANRWRIAALDREDNKSRTIGPSVAERRQDLVSFYNHYEELVLVVCEAAHYGPTTSARGQYLNLQAWMQQHYPTVQPFVTTYLADDREAEDPFMALVAAEHLDDLVMQDDGSLMHHINETRDALNSYAEHLRQLAARRR
jgi:hypothetical protein